MWGWGLCGCSLHEVAWDQGGLSAQWLVCFPEGYVKTQSHTEGERHVTVGTHWKDVAATGGMSRMAISTPRSWRKREDSALEPLGGVWSADTLTEDSRPPQLWRIKFCGLRLPSLWCFVTVAPGHGLGAQRG